MGMLVTLYLISANVYNAVDAPPGRGFSYIELWMVGMQFPILFALVEYSIILGVMKYSKYKNEMKSTFVIAVKPHETDQRQQIRYPNHLFYKIDLFSFIFSLFSFITFCLVYWTLLKDLELMGDLTELKL